MMGHTCTHYACPVFNRREELGSFFVYKCASIGGKSRQNNTQQAGRKAKDSEKTIMVRLGAWQGVTN